MPVADLIINGHLDLYEDIQSHNYFHITLRRDTLHLLAGDFVGLFPLNARVTLQVEPKIARNNWLHIVGRANAQLKDLPFLRQYSRTDYLSKSTVEFLSRALITQLTPIYQLGVLRQYVAHRELTAFPRGHILFKESMSSAWSRGHRKRVAVQYHHYSKDTPHNRLLRFALHLACRYLLSMTIPVQPLPPHVADLENLFSGVPLDRSLAYLDTVLTALETDAVPRARTYYIDACKTAALIVQNLPIIPDLIGTDSTLSFVVYMPDVFERYCVASLRRNRHLIGDGITVKAKDGKKRLFGPQDPDSRLAEPDVVIEERGSVQTPLEIKYTDQPTRHHIEQAVAYALSYGSLRAGLVCYASSNATQGWQYHGKVGETVEVWTYRIDLSSPDLEAAETTFASDIARFLHGSPELA